MKYKHSVNEMRVFSFVAQVCLGARIFFSGNLSLVSNYALIICF